jgi:hypothetical protein
MTGFVNFCIRCQKNLSSNKLQNEHHRNLLVFEKIDTHTCDFPDLIKYKFSLPYALFLEEKM